MNSYRLIPTHLLTSTFPPRQFTAASFPQCSYVDYYKQHKVEPSSQPNDYHSKQEVTEQRNHPILTSIQLVP